VVIDTPMARLDSAHRHNFINKYLPNASSQVIVLSTDEEVYGRYLYQIQEHVNSYYTLLYDEQEKCTSIVPGYFEEVTQ
jgi:DNA sulfur modification protein DndD